MTAPTPALIPGEDAATSDPQAIQHWLRIYGELLAYEERMLTTATKESRKLAPSRQNASGHDIELIRSAVERFKHRYSYWVNRQSEMHGIALDPESRTVMANGRIIRLTKREFQVLSALHRSFGQPMRPRHLLASAWSDTALSLEQLRLYIWRLRSKLRDIDTVEIHTIDGGGGYSLISRVTDASSNEGDSPPRHAATAAGDGWSLRRATEGAKVPNDFSDLEEAVRHGADPSEPMPDEPSTGDADRAEATHWVRSYRGLLDLEERLEREILTALEAFDEAARREAEATNLPLIRSQKRRFELRLQQWERRLGDLTTKPDDPAS